MKETMFEVQKEEMQNLKQDNNDLKRYTEDLQFANKALINERNILEEKLTKARIDLDVTDADNQKMQKTIKEQTEKIENLELEILKLKAKFFDVLQNQYMRTC